MTKYTELRYPLGSQVKAGIDTLNNLHLNTECSMADDIEDLADFADILVSAHAPASVGDIRLNAAAKDAEFRTYSIGVVTDYIDKAREYPKVKQINLHFGMKRWTQRGGEGDYQLQIEGIREIAEYCDSYDLELVLENLNAYWSGIEGASWDEVDWTERNEAFGMSPEEWIAICEDVDRANVGLCLDSSHTCTYAHKFSPEQREERVLAFLNRPELIRHVHWNDNYLYDDRGQNDSHAALNRGTLPTEMHRKIKYLDATLLMEHFHGIDVLREELAFIDTL